MGKIAIVTWTKWNNYGTILQSFALYKYIKNCGYDVVVLDDRYISSTKCVEVFGVGTPWQYFKNYLKSFLIKRRGFDKIIESRDKMCAREKRQKINYNIKNVQYRLLDKLSEIYDTFICGSDQIWTPNETYFDPYYFLGFANGKRKISYAPSIGVTEYPEDKKEIIKPILETFNALSVREETGSRIISEICGKEVKVCLDPTLLLDSEIWKKEFDIKGVQNDYALCYFLGEQDWYRKMTIDFCRNNSIKLITIPMYEKDMTLGDDARIVGPCGFLELVANAKYVFTDSYHGMLFSIIFHRNVHIFSRFKNSDKLSQNSRIEDFVKKIGITDRYYSNDSIVIHTENIDYKEIDNRIDELRKGSQEYLITALNG